MLKFLKSEDIKLYISLFIISLVSYHFAYGLFTLNPSNTGWLLNAYHDWGQHYLGPAFYRYEAWHFPLGDMKSFYYPVGTNVGFTDSIPLMAFLLKIFDAVLPEDFQYYGFWLFTCMFISAYYTKKILKLYNVNNYIIIIAGILIVTNPVIIFRGMQASADTHWLIIGSFYYYLKPTTSLNVISNFKKQGLLVLLSYAINPYIALMTTGFVIVLAFKNYFYDKSINLKQTFLLPTISLSVALLFWVLFGMIEFNNATDLNVGNIYGTIYSFNLNSFFNSYGFYSKYIPQLGMLNEQQHEGFAYLGLGLIIVVLISIVIMLYFIITKRLTKKHLYALPLLMLCILMLLFAITNVVSYNLEVLFTYPTLGIVKKVGNIFRAVGRFSWPLYYLMIVMSILIISKLKIKPVFIIIPLLFLTLFQLYDIENLITARDLKSGKFVSKLDEKKWKNVIDNFDEIITYPAYSNNMVYKMDYQDLMYVALKSHKPISIGYVARENVKGGTAFNDTILNSIKRGEIEKNRLYVTNSANIKDFNVLIYKNKVTIKRLNKFILLYSKDVKLKNDYTQLEENIKFIDSLRKNTNVTTSNIVFTGKWETQGNINSNLENFSNTDDFIRGRGWAYLKNVKNNLKDTIYIGLSSKTKTYLFKTQIVKRGDVTTFADAENLENAGFNCDIFTDKLPKETYSISIVIKDKNGKFHNNSIDKLSEVGKKTYKSSTTLVALPQTSSKLISNLEIIEDKVSFYKFSGWAFIKDFDSTKSNINLVLINKEKNYVFETDIVNRHDVTKFNNTKFNYDNSGFTLKIKKNTLQKGEYKIGIVITNLETNTKTFKLNEKTVVF